MKNILYIPIIILFALITSCDKISPSQEGGDETSGSYIFFEPKVLNLSSTKATLLNELPKTNGTAFGVCGYYSNGADIFSGYSNKIANVYKSGEYYQYDNLALWLGIDHTFYAFYPYSLHTSVKKDGTGKLYIEYATPETSNDMQDILATTKTTSYAGGNPAPVSLNLEHIFWALKVKIENRQTRELVSGNESDDILLPSITIKKIEMVVSGYPKIASLYLDASSTYSTAETNLDEFTYTIYENTTGTAITAYNPATPNAEYSATFEPLLFIPLVQDQSFNYRLKISYTTQSGDSETSIYPSDNSFKTSTAAFQRGNVYTITIEKTDDKLIYGTLEDGGRWEDFDDLEHSFQ